MVFYILCLSFIFPSKGSFEYGQKLPISEGSRQYRASAA